MFGTYSWSILLTCAINEIWTNMDAWQGPTKSKQVLKREKNLAWKIHQKMILMYWESLCYWTSLTLPCRSFSTHSPKLMNMDVGVDGPMDSVQVGKEVQNCVLFANMHSTQQNLTESLELKLSFSHNNELLASSRLRSSLIAFLRAESGSWGWVLCAQLYK